VHSPITFNLIFKIDSSDPVTANSANEKTKGWTDTKHNEFLINLDRDKLTNVIVKLSDDTNVNKEHLNDVMLDIEHLLRDSGKVTLGTYIPGKNTQCKNNSKRWYNNECKMTRNRYHRWRKAYNLRRDETNNRNMLNASKEYKAVIKKSVNKYKRQFK